jgi:hypothetical protein
MSIKFIPKVGAAVILLVIVLIFLGVNYVPKINALTLPQRNSVAAINLVRPNYVNESYPRSIAPQLSLAGSDWIERHPVLLTQAGYLAGSDWIERHPSTYLVNSDWIERHPSPNYINSDWLKRHQSHLPK